ncbi:hypothetical protein GGTG_07655 [Gaeumannomyces tritici R3-111a-1]|uniref:Cytochrome P450 n=1 Tax=Gaeumannomyces tritici (strain R3-111a-1) TaxID=644352 RepID=J3P2A7_GAET3|nr:hypothetical protein GGTG_07655 [Gaeumannomyces tritici R3-111a-1]EJT73799.1 hypothetical protein GGTG_07655 [Gaeumannomyces tritici R3-111a-1]
MPHPLVFIIVLKSTSNTMHSIYILVLAYLSVIFLRHCLKARARSKELQKLAAEHGCAPAPSLDGRFSWGISLLREWIQADSQHRLMQLILFHMRQSGWTIHQQLLNQTILVTVDPANLEAMLNSKAGGAWCLTPHHIHTHNLTPQLNTPPTSPRLLRRPPPGRHPALRRRRLHARRRGLAPLARPDPPAPGRSSYLLTKSPCRDSFILVRHPSVLSKLRTEIATNPIPPPDLRRADLKAMPYLQAVLREVLRLYPPAPVNARTAARDTGPARGRRGSTAASPCWPERWLDDDDDDDDDEGAVGVAGPACRFSATRWRVALRVPAVRRRASRLHRNGRFALTEAAYAVVRILDRFPAIALPEGEKVEPLGSEKHGCNVRLG